jgi:hypothetical protein
MSSSNANEKKEQGISGRIGNFMDQQRLERLRQCQEIDVILKNCLARRSELLDNKTPTEPALDIEHSIPGTRMMRYFGWHEEIPVNKETTSFSSLLSSGGANQDATSRNAAAQQESSTTKSSSSFAIPSCAKEMHALWACRSVCLGCAKHLKNVKDCLDGLPNDVISIPETAYEPTSYTGLIPCRQSQEELGKCVIQQAKELQQRLNRNETKK